MIDDCAIYPFLIPKIFQTLKNKRNLYNCMQNLLILQIILFSKIYIFCDISNLQFTRIYFYRGNSYSVSQPRCNYCTVID